MSNLFPNGGPVHPVRLPIPGATHDIDAPQPTELHTGMSLRDHFAGLAMQQHMQALSAAKTEPGTTWSEVVAALAYQMADAMLCAREKDDEA